MNSNERNDQIQGEITEENENTQEKHTLRGVLPKVTSRLTLTKKNSNKNAFIDDSELVQSITKGTTSIDSPLFVSDLVHSFYYPWYGSEAHDGKWRHWNHKTLPHWTESVNRQYPIKQHNPPDDVASSFYPLLGPYSSIDEQVIETHMKYSVIAGIGVLVVSWYPHSLSDDGFLSVDNYMPIIMDLANKYHIKIAFHIEPYKDRSALSVKADLKYIIDTYGNHPAFYRYNRKPLVYIYDSYLIDYNEWNSILDDKGANTIRNTAYDSIVIGLAVQATDCAQLTKSNFNGIYTYFASEGFTYGSTYHNWNQLSYSVRPWNQMNTRQRNDGAYYTQAWEEALRHNPGIISITSFNEWHEGTQIEPAIIKDSYMNYGSDPYYYLKLTKTTMSSKVVNQSVHLSKCCSCCHCRNPFLVCSSVLLIIPLSIMIFGLAMLFANNTRIQRLEDYNNASSAWSEYQDIFSKSEFRLNGESMTMITKDDGEFYPVRDDCKKTGDPEQGCNLSNPTFFQTTVDKKNTQYTIDDGHFVLFNETIDQKVVKKFTKEDLGCEKEEICRDKCKNRDGKWALNSCTVTYEFSEICLRVRKNEDHYILDLPASQPFLTGFSSAGCSYKNDFNHIIYSKKPSPKITIQVRHAYDPYIVADYYTSGCSSEKITSIDCFGVCASQQFTGGIVLFSLSIVLFCIWIILMISLNVKYKEEEQRKSKRLSVKTVTAIPSSPLSTNNLPYEIYNPAHQPISAPQTSTAPSNKSYRTVRL
ncbi:hypothetical protein WA158_005022 [Blastocystis sp. Blastoise]